MKRNQFSKDPKVKLISIDEFLVNNNFLIDAKDNLLNDNERPLYLHKYFKITEKYLTAIDYTITRINYGMDKSEKLETIYVAKRDGLTEYKLFDEQILILKEMAEKINEDKQKKQINNQIEQLLNAKKYCPHTKIAQ